MLQISYPLQMVQVRVVLFSEKTCFRRSKQVVRYKKEKKSQICNFSHFLYLKTCFYLWKHVFPGVNHSTSIWVQAPKICFLHHSLKKKNISTSVWSVYYLNTGRKIQQLLLISRPKIKCHSLLGYSILMRVHLQFLDFSFDCVTLRVIHKWRHAKRGRGVSHFVTTGHKA